MATPLLTPLTVVCGHAAKLELMRHKQKCFATSGKYCERRGQILPSSFLLSAIWKKGVMAGAGEEILDHNMNISMKCTA
jgi:hypothetical protein